jgi:hypothetical protein
MKYTFSTWKARVSLAFLFIGSIAALTAAMPLTALADNSCPPSVFAGAGPSAKDIKQIVREFREALGEPDNGGALGPLPTGRREINWDGGTR